MNQEELNEWYSEQSDMDIAKHINLALLMCDGISDTDAGFDIVTSINSVGIERIAEIISRVRLAAKSTSVGAV